MQIMRRESQIVARSMTEFSAPYLSEQAAYIRGILGAAATEDYLNDALHETYLSEVENAQTVLEFANMLPTPSVKDMTSRLTDKGSRAFVTHAKEQHYVHTGFLTTDKMRRFALSTHMLWLDYQPGAQTDYAPDPSIDKFFHLLAHQYIVGANEKTGELLTVQTKTATILATVDKTYECGLNTFKLDEINANGRKVTDDADRKAELLKLSGKPVAKFVKGYQRLMTADPAIRNLPGIFDPATNATKVMSSDAASSVIKTDDIKVASLERLSDVDMSAFHVVEYLNYSAAMFDKQAEWDVLMRRATGDAGDEEVASVTELLQARTGVSAPSLKKV